MVIYYSSTGNTAFIARRLAKLLDDESLNLLERIKTSDYSALYSKKPFVICTPIHVGDIPQFVHNYLMHTRLLGNRNVYFVFSSGGFVGKAGLLSEWRIDRKSMIFRGYADPAMPQNYMASNLFSDITPDEKRIRIRQASEDLSTIADRIREGKSLSFGSGSVNAVLTLLVVSFWTHFAQKTGPFYVKDSCIGCGKCERVCPLNRIKMEDGRPKWSGNYCAHCMACIGSCPKEAIGYGTATDNKEIYHIEKYL